MKENEEGSEVRIEGKKKGRKEIRN